MKHLTNRQTKEKNQICTSNAEPLTVAPGTTILLKPTTSRSNIFLVQNIGKDPPGRWRSPDAACCQNPYNPTALLQSYKTLFRIDYQAYKQIQNPNFINN